MRRSEAVKSVPVAVRRNGVAERHGDDLRDDIEDGQQERLLLRSSDGRVGPRCRDGGHVPSSTERHGDDLRDDVEDGQQERLLLRSSAGRVGPSCRDGGHVHSSAGVPQIAKMTFAGASQRAILLSLMACLCASLYPMWVHFKESDAESPGFLPPNPSGNVAVAAQMSSVTSSSTSVLIMRTVSPSETSGVAADVVHVKSFYSGQHTTLLQKSMSRCNKLKSMNTSHDALGLDPFEIGSDIFPNHLMCIKSNGTSRVNDNYFTAVEADFMLFARSQSHAEQLRREIEIATLNGTNTSSPYHNVLVDIRDVSHNPKKVYNWIVHADRPNLDAYDYVWFVDGDIRLSSLNWQGFWTHVKTTSPKIAQASVIGQSATQPGTEWTTLRHQSDPRLIAGEVPILEVQAPLLEVETWLQYRDLILSEPNVTNDIRLGGENCFDMGWCHMAKSNMTGKQERGPIMDNAIGYREDSPKVDATARGRSCVVFYQTPIQHISKRTRVVDATFQEATRNLCRFFRDKKGVIGAGGLWTVYELFTAPDSS